MGGDDKDRMSGSMSTAEAVPPLAGEGHTETNSVNSKRMSGFSQNSCMHAAAVLCVLFRPMC